MRPMLALVAVVLGAALAVATPVRVVKYDDAKKELTVRAIRLKKGEAQKDETYTLTDKVKFTDGDAELAFEDAVKKLTGKKLPKAIDLTIEDKKLVGVKFVAKKEKKADK